MLFFVVFLTPISILKIWLVYSTDTNVYNAGSFQIPILKRNIYDGSNGFCKQSALREGGGGGEGCGQFMLLLFSF